MSYAYHQLLILVANSNISFQCFERSFFWQLSVEIFFSFFTKEVKFIFLRREKQANIYEYYQAEMNEKSELL